MSKEKLEKLEREKYVVERKLTAAMHKEKRLQSELKRLTRSERTHRLCTRAGMLETFLKEPTTLTDDDVMELLTFIFHSEAIQKKLDLLIENRKETEQPNGSSKTLLEKGRTSILSYREYVRPAELHSPSAETTARPRMFRHFVPSRELHSLAPLMRLSPVYLPSANSMKCCSPPASLKNRIPKIRPLTGRNVRKVDGLFLSPKSKKEVKHNDKTENP